MQMQTSEYLHKIDIPGVKIHLLAAMENTPLGKLYLEGKWKPLSFEEYILLVCDFIERLPKNCIIHRTGGNGHPMHMLTPKWLYHKKAHIVQSIIQELNRRGSFQGSYFNRSL